MRKPAAEQLSIALWQGKAFLKWVVLALVVGTVVGAAGVAFHHALTMAALLRVQRPWLLLLLPGAGALIALLYRLAGMERDKGTNFVLAAVRIRWRLRLRTAPLIALSTVLTHLCGGSAGREGAALQMGGCISAAIGRFVRLDEHDTHIITLCGMAAGFSALFGTPIASAVFAMEVVSVGVMYYSAIVPCTLAALTASLLAGRYGVDASAFVLAGPLPALDWPALLRVGGLGVLLALLSGLFCLTMGGADRLYHRLLPNACLRGAAGGALVAALVLVCSWEEYTGAGMEVIARAVGGQAEPEAFLIKLLLTALTLGAGFKGGEIVPAFFVGATFGCAAAPLLGLPAAFGAALGLVGVFCGVTNCPLASILLSFELFGGRALPLFAFCCAVCYALSGYHSLYAGQEIRFSKFRPVQYEDGRLPPFRPGWFGLYRGGPEDGARAGEDRER